MSILFHINEATNVFFTIHVDISLRTYPAIDQRLAAGPALGRMTTTLVKDNGFLPTQLLD